MGIENTGSLHGDHAYTVRGLPARMIQIDGLRKRPLDAANVTALKESILEQGQVLQHIGVQATQGADGGPFKLVYGAHRLQAVSELFEEGKVASENVPCVIYTSDTPRWFIELAEISENLARKELTSAERDAHTTRMAAIIVERDGVKAARGKGGDYTSTSARGRGANGGSPIAQQETAVEAIAKATGVTSQTASRRIKAAAASAGVADFKLEEATSEQLRDIADKAAAKAKDTMQDRAQRAVEARQQTVAKPAPAPTPAAPSPEAERVAELSKQVLDLRKENERLLGELTKARTDVEAQVKKRVDAYIAENLDADARKALKAAKSIRHTAYPLTLSEFRLLQKGLHPDNAAQYHVEALVMLESKQGILVKPELPIGATLRLPTPPLPDNLEAAFAAAEAQRKEDARLRRDARRAK
jgi:hypothetical protein